LKEEKMSDENLIKVSAFYNNNSPKGLGFSLVNTSNNLELTINDLIRSYEEAWESANEDERKEMVQIYFNQLNRFATLRAEGKDGDRSEVESLLCLVNIWFLENYGFLESDKYNGCVFLYV
jgi:hypothetical protein